MKDNINHPEHYNQGGVECIDAMEAATVNKKGAEAVCTSNVIKYLWRYELKNGIEDVKKARWYLDRLITELESKPAVTAGAKLDVSKAEPVECAKCHHVWQRQLRDPDLKTCLVCGKVEDVYE